MGKPIQFHYKFTLPDAQVKEFDVRLDFDTLLLSVPQREDYPEWTALGHKKCTNCPLNEKHHPHCPVARNMVDVIDFCKDMLSYEEVDVEITTQDRTYKKHVALQHALSSLIGIYMVSSGCPVLDKLRPMVRTHLPFPNLQETIYRSISMYLVAQYFLFKKGKTPDWEMQNLHHIYKEIEIVNRCFRERIVDLHTEDAGLNALFHLNTHAQFTNRMLLEEELHDIEKLFKPYLENPS